MPCARAPLGGQAHVQRLDKVDQDVQVVLGPVSSSPDMESYGKDVEYADNVTRVKQMYN